MLTVTRIRFAAGGTGGQSQKSRLPSGDPPPLPGMPRCSAPVSSVARSWKHGAIIGQYSPLSHGCPYSWMVTRSSCAAMLSITAVASLAAEDELFERVEHTVKERTRVREALIADGWDVPPTEANFVWLGLGEHTLDFAASCFDEGIAIRPFAGDGARVSIGDAEANDAFLAIAHAFGHRSPAD